MSMKYGDDPRREGPTDWGVTRTKTSAEAECNINNIMKRHKRTGQLTHISNALMEYRDVSGLPDLHEAMNVVANANSLFNELPSAIRRLCHHDAANFLPFIDDPENLEVCQEHNILPPTAKAKDVPIERDMDSLKPETPTDPVPT